MLKFCTTVNWAAFKSIIVIIDLFYTWERFKRLKNIVTFSYFEKKYKIAVFRYVAENSRIKHYQYFTLKKISTTCWKRHDKS